MAEARQAEEARTRISFLVGSMLATPAEDPIHVGGYQEGNV
jgi:hypothetical protein